MFVKLEKHRSNFQQRVALGIKAGRFHIDNHGKKTAKSIGNYCRCVIVYHDDSIPEPVHERETIPAVP